MSEEQRQTPRVVHQIIARFHQHGSPKAWSSAPLKDFSKSGVRFPSEQSFPVGVMLDLSLSLPLSKTPVLVKARVMRRKAGPIGCFEYGVSFEELDDVVAGMLEETAKFFLKKTQD